MHKPKTSWVNRIPEGFLLLQQGLQALYHLVLKAQKEPLAEQVTGWSLKETIKKDLKEKKTRKFHSVGSEKYYSHNYKKPDLAAVHKKKRPGDFVGNKLNRTEL